MNNFIKHKELDGVEKSLFKAIQEQKMIINDLIKNEQEMKAHMNSTDNKFKETAGNE